MLYSVSIHLSIIPNFNINCLSDFLLPVLYHTHTLPSDPKSQQVVPSESYSKYVTRFLAIETRMWAKFSRMENIFVCPSLFSNHFKQSFNFTFGHSFSQNDPKLKSLLDFLHKLKYYEGSKRY